MPVIVGCKWFFFVPNRKKRTKIDINTEKIVNLRAKYKTTL